MTLPILATGWNLNKQQYIDFMKGMKSAMSNMNMEFTHVINEGDMVNIRFITTCKHTGNFMGAPATNKNLNIGGIFIRKVKGNKLFKSGKLLICCDDEPDGIRHAVGLLYLQCSLQAKIIIGKIKQATAKKRLPVFNPSFNKTPDRSVYNSMGVRFGKTCQVWREDLVICFCAALSRVVYH